jgi:hypothetical protein
MKTTWLILSLTGSLFSKGLFPGTFENPWKTLELQQQLEGEGGRISIENAGREKSLKGQGQGYTRRDCFSKVTWVEKH